MISDIKLRKKTMNTEEYMGKMDKVFDWYKAAWSAAGYDFDDEQLEVLWRLGVSTQNHKGMVTVILVAYAIGKGNERRRQQDKALLESAELQRSIEQMRNGDVVDL